MIFFIFQLSKNYLLDVIIKQYIFVKCDKFLKRIQILLFCYYIYINIKHFLIIYFALITILKNYYKTNIIYFLKINL